MTVKVIFCFTDPKYLQIAKEEGMMTGVRQHHIRTQNMDYAEFLDNDFKHPDPSDFLNMVQSHHPRLAILPDIITPQHLKAALFIHGLVHEDTDCIFVPKRECVNRLPINAILGYPVPNKFSNTPLPLEAFANHKIHVLGGTPMAQRKIADALTVLDSPLYSVDGNSFSRLCFKNHKAFNHRTPHWRKRRTQTVETIFRESCREVMQYWEAYL